MRHFPHGPLTALALMLALTACASPATPAPAASTFTPLPPPTGTPEPVHLTVGVLSFMSTLPVHIAVEKGYFAEQGLDVELVGFGTSDRDMVPALLQGQLDVGATTPGPAVLNAIALGNTSKFVADKSAILPEAACFSEAMVARSALLDDGTLDSLEGLRGLTITDTRGNFAEWATDRMLEEAGLTEDDLEVVDVRDNATRLEAMRSGTLDVTHLAEPWITRFEQAGVGRLWLPDARWFPNYSTGSIIFGPAMLERDRDIGVRFMAAYLQAVAAYNEGKTDENVAMAASFTQLEPEELRQVCWPSFQPDGLIDVTQMMAFQEWALENGHIDTVLPIEQVWDPTYVQEAAVLLGR